MANNDIDNTNLSLKKLISTFQGIADAHGEIQSFGSGDATYIGGSTIKQYPLLWVDYLPSQFTENSITYNVRVIVADLIENGESDLVNRRHTTISTLKDVFTVLSQAYDIDVNFNATAYPFQDDKVDKITGWYTDISINIPSTYTLCDVPFKTLVSGSGGFVFPGNSGAGVSIYVSSSLSVSLSGNGTISSPITANVNISAVPGNSLSINADGLYASAGTLAGTFATTASFNAFTSSYVADSASFNTRINNVTGSGGTVNTGSLLLTSSFQAYTASNETHVSNVYASESNYLPTASFIPFSASYVTDSSSFLNKITAATYNPAQLNSFSASILNYTASVNGQLSNIYASESNYLPTASFNSFSASYVVDSASILVKIGNATYNPAQLNSFSASILNYTGSVNTQVANVYASESNYLPTASFNTFSASYHTDSASFDSRINSVGGGYNPAQLNAFSASILNYTGSVNTQLVNIFASESNYTPTSSFNSLSSSVSTLSGSVSTLSGSLYTKINNVFASESNYTPTSSFNTFSASYVVDSSSFLTKIANATYNPAQLNAFTSSIQTQVTNVFASESNYTPTSSFNSLSSSYHTDSSSFDSRINGIASYNPAQLNAFSASILTYTGSVNTQLTNIFASESNYTPTSSFNTLSSSIHTDSASLYTKVNNVFASESNYVPTASYNPFTASYFADSSSFNTRINSAGGGSSNLPFSTQNNSYTLVLGDANTGILMNSGSAMNLTVPSSSTVNFPTGSQIVIEQAGAGAVTIVPVAGVTLQGTGLVTSGQYSVIVLIKQASDTWFVGSPDVSLSGLNTWTQNQTFNGGIDIGAGTAANPPLQFATASAVLTTASIAGAVEVDSNGIKYYTYQNGSRGVDDSEQFVALTASFTMVSQTAAQRMFPAGTDELAVRPATSYFFEALFTLSSLSATNGTFGFNLSGSATLTSQGWTAFATKGGALNTPLNVSCSMTYNTAANTALTTNSVVTTGMARISGIIRTNAAGTLVPAISLSQTSAAVVGANSYFRIWPVGTNTVQSVGNFS